MRRFRMVVVFALGAVFGAGIQANDVNTGGQLGIVRTFSAYTLGKTGLHLGGSFKFGTEMDYAAGPGGSGSVQKIGSGGTRTGITRDNPFLFTGDVYCAYGLLSFLDASLDMPIYFDVTGWGEDMAGAGDLQLALKMAYPFQRENAFFSHSYYLKVIFPTGNIDRGFFPRHSYYLRNDSGLNTFTTDAVFFNPLIAWTFDFERLSSLVPIQVHMNFGGVIAQSKSSSIFQAAVGLIYTPVEPVSFFAEISGESRVSHYSSCFDPKAINDDPLWVSPGIRFNLPLGFYLTLAGDIGISDNGKEVYIDWEREGYAYSTKATPRYGAQMSLGWKGILKEDDSDGDGIIDKKDGCPKEAEDKDGFKDDDGCPDNDNDGDGFIDSKDRCPDSAGTDGGCPVYDTDGDNINDASDKCPQEAEDRDGFEDDDGCPDNDNDNDGVADVEDKCPGVRGLPDNNGCPKTKEITRGKLVLSGVTFQAGKAVLSSNSYTILDQVYESLVEWPEVKLEIQGHTDNVGNNMLNLKLSQMRADAVRLYLIQKGIDSSRLRSVGYGEEFPIADNHSADGREKNRRVELRRID